MLRLPSFTYRQPKTLKEALAMKADAGPDGMYVAGGTDLYPNMKRRHQEPRTVISLMGVPELAECGVRNAECGIGPCVTLTALADHPTIRRDYAAVAHAAELVSTPLLRNMGTLGGNLCLDTRCNYYNQSYEWRKAIDFCMKKDGHICWVAPSSPRCWAVSSSDVAPVMVALGADYVLVGPGGERVVEARIVLGGVASWPQEVPEAGAALAGSDLSDEAIAAAADAAYRPAKPMDNTDFDLSWRKQMTRVYVARALAELRQRRRAAK